MQPATFHSSAEVVTQMASCMELTVESEVCFLSCASHLQSRDSSSYFRNHAAQWHNQSAATTSFTLPPQPKTLHSLLSLLRALECIRVFVFGFFFLFCLLLSASVTVHAGVGCSRCFTLLPVWCVQKQENWGPREGMSDGREIHVLMKNLTHVSGSPFLTQPPCTCAPGRIKQLDGPVCV